MGECPRQKKEHLNAEVNIFKVTALLGRGKKLLLTIVLQTLTGSSDLATAHREEVREQYYAYTGKETLFQTNKRVNNSIIHTNIVLLVIRLRRRGNLPATRYVIYTVHLGDDHNVNKYEPSKTLKLTLTHHKHILFPIDFPFFFSHRIPLVFIITMSMGSLHVLG